MPLPAFCGKRKEERPPTILTCIQLPSASLLSLTAAPFPHTCCPALSCPLYWLGCLRGMLLLCLLQTSLQAARCRRALAPRRSATTACQNARARQPLGAFYRRARCRNIPLPRYRHLLGASSGVNVWLLFKGAAHIAPAAASLLPVSSTSWADVLRLSALLALLRKASCILPVCLYGGNQDRLRLFCGVSGKKGNAYAGGERRSYPSSFSHRYRW